MIGPHAAVGRLVLQAEQAHGTQFGEELVGRERARRLPGVHMRLDLPLEEVPQRLAKDLVLVGFDHRRRLLPGHIELPGAPPAPYTAQR